MNRPTKKMLSVSAESCIKKLGAGSALKFLDIKRFKKLWSKAFGNNVRSLTEKTEGIISGKYPLMTGTKTAIQ